MSDWAEMFYQIWSLSQLKSYSSFYDFSNTCISSFSHTIPNELLLNLLYLFHEPEVHSTPLY